MTSRFQVTYYCYITPGMFCVFTGTRHGISIIITEMSSLRKRSSRGKCFMTREKLKEPENKIQDVNQVLNL